MSRKGIEIKSAIGYTIATLFSRGLAIITIPIFTRIMSTTEIGTVSIYNSWNALISTIASLSLASGGFAVAMKEYEGKRDQYVSSVLSLTSMVSLLLFLVYVVATDFWNDILGLPTELVVLMLIGFLVAPARDFWLSRQRYEYKYKLASIITLVSGLFASLTSVLVVIYMSNHSMGNLAQGRLFTNYFVLNGVAAIIWVYLMLKGRTFYKKEYWNFSLMLSLPLVGYSIAAQVLDVSDKLMISKLVNNSSLGIYSTLYLLSSLSLLVWNTLNASFVPYLFRNMGNAQSNVKKVSFKLLSSYSLLAVILTLFAPEIVRILAPPEYLEAIYIMPPIAAGIFLTSVAHMYSNILVYYKKTKYVMCSAIIAAVVNVILNYIFIPPYGYQAAAYTTFIAYVLLACSQAFWGNRVHIQETKAGSSVYDNKKISILVVLTILASLSGLVLYRFSSARYSVGVLLVLFVSVWVLKLIINNKNITFRTK